MQADPRRYQYGQADPAGSGSGSGSDSFPVVSLPPGWEWDGPWSVECQGHVDHAGWAYGSTWSALTYPLQPGCGSRRPTDMVRRRR